MRGPAYAPALPPPAPHPGGPPVVHRRTGPSTGPRGASPRCVAPASMAAWTGRRTPADGRGARRVQPSSPWCSGSPRTSGSPRRRGRGRLGPWSRVPRTPGRWARPPRSSCGRSWRRRTGSGPGTAAWTWPPPRARPCSPPRRVWSSSPARSPAAVWCPCSTPTGCGRPTSPSPPRCGPARRSCAVTCSARCGRGTPAARPAACTGASAATGPPTSTRCGCSPHRTSGCSRCPIRGRTGWTRWTRWTGPSPSATARRGPGGAVHARGCAWSCAAFNRSAVTCV